jgi:hypothetical protein
MKYGVSPYDSEIWIRGQLSSDGQSWQPLGIYAAQAEADQACLTITEFIGPITLGQPWPTGNWPLAYYPRQTI